MRYCPTCETRFEDEKIRFCTKDGTPLIEEESPSFTENLPSENVEAEDDAGEETIVRHKRPAASPAERSPAEPEPEGSSRRIVIDTANEVNPPSRPPGGRAAVIQPAVQRSGPSTGLIVFFSVLGTLIVVIGIFVIYLLLTIRAGEANVNINGNGDLNTNGNIETNYNGNDLLNLGASPEENANSDLNANANTPTPTPSPSPSPSETPESNSNVNANVNVNANTVARPSPPQANVNAPAPKPSASGTPSPTTAPSNSNRPVNIGTINGRAISLPLPAYPSSARQVRATGRVVVAVTLDRQGKVVSARATAGHPLLRRAAEDAALRSRFQPASVGGTAVPAKGNILYNFVD